MSGMDSSVFAPVKASAARRQRQPLLSVRHPLSPRAQMVAGVLAFALPLFLWCVLSYAPFLWHPQVLVEDAGDTTVAGQYSFVAVGQRVDLDVFQGRNAELAAVGARQASGERVNPIFLPAPHEVAPGFLHRLHHAARAHGRLLVAREPVAQLQHHLDGLRLLDAPRPARRALVWHFLALLSADRAVRGLRALHAGTRFRRAGGRRARPG